MWGGFLKNRLEEGAWKEVSHGQTVHLCRISALSTLPIKEASILLSPRENENTGREGADRVFGSRLRGVSLKLT